MVTPKEALSRYKGEKADAEKALLAVFEATNKGLAHMTWQLSAPERNLLLIARKVFQHWSPVIFTLP